VKARVCFALLIVLPIFTGCGTDFPNEPAADVPTALALRSALEEGAGASSGAAAVALPEPTGWATLRGVFKMNGSPPAPAPLSTAVTHADAQVCAPGGKAPVSEEVVVGPSGGLSGVAIFLNTRIPTEDPKWINESYNALRGTEMPFDQRHCTFTSHVAAIWTAQKLKVLNSDPVGHNTKISGGSNSFNETIGAGGSTVFQPAGEERSPAAVSCSIHPWMSAYLLPRDNPYFAVTNENGEFEIANIPAGVELEFRVWQPKLGFVDAAVNVNGQSQQISKGRVKLTLNDGEAREFNVDMDAGLFQ
jgi:hypothetical protein